MTIRLFWSCPHEGCDFEQEIEITISAVATRSVESRANVQCAKCRRDYSIVLDVNENPE
jgi:hypothetical protein